MSRVNLRLIAEYQPAHIGVEAIGAYDEIEGARRSMLEGHMRARVVLPDTGDRVVEEIFDVVACRLVEDAHQIAAQNLDLGNQAT